MESLYTKKRIQVIVCAVILAVCFLGLLFFARQMEYRKQEVMSMKEKLAAYDQNKKIFEQEARRLQVVGARASKLEAQRITTNNLPTLLSSFETLATTHKATFAITQVETPTVETGPQKLMISFSAHGALSDLEGLLNAMSHQIYQVRFINFSLYEDRDEKGSNGWDVLAKLEVVSF